MSVIFSSATARSWRPSILRPLPCTGKAVTAFAAGLLDGRDLAKIPWDTLLLIAGGLTLGNLFEHSGLASALAAAVNWGALPRSLACDGTLYCHGSPVSDVQSFLPEAIQPERHALLHP